MYLHLGGNLVVAVRDIVSILDGRMVGSSEVNQEFVDHARRNHRLHGGLPAEWKSLVVTVEGIYPSGISAATLARRMTHFRQSAAAWEPET
ncbi:MAG TPA: DUF370 domain-containing protein [bacterium]|jgi:hypothetical protein